MKLAKIILALSLLAPAVTFAQPCANFADTLNASAHQPASLAGNSRGWFMDKDVKIWPDNDRDDAKLDAMLNPLDNAGRLSFRALQPNMIANSPAECKYNLSVGQQNVNVIIIREHQ